MIYILSGVDSEGTPNIVNDYGQYVMVVKLIEGIPADEFGRLTYSVQADNEVLVLIQNDPKYPKVTP